MPRYGQQKPPLGSQLMPGHPLAQGLVLCSLLNEGSGTTVGNLVSGTNPAQFATQNWVNGNAGFKIGSNNSEINYTNYTAIDTATFTFLVGFIPYGVQIANTRLIEKGGNSEWGMMWAGDGTSLVVQNGINIIINGPTTIARTPTIAAMVCSPSGTSLFKNGVNVGTTASTVTTGTADLHIGQYHGNVGRFEFNGEVSQLMMWNRQLTPAEHQWLAADPYAMFSRPSRRTYSVPAATGVTRYVNGGQISNILVNGGLIAA